jgi:hypothetical protein
MNSARPGLLRIGGVFGVVLGAGLVVDTTAAGLGLGLVGLSLLALVIGLATAPRPAAPSRPDRPGGTKEHQ